MRRVGDQDGAPDVTRFTPSEFFVWRTPLLAFDELIAWGEGLAAPAVQDDAGRLPEALACDRVLLRTRMRAIFRRPAVREALFLAAPEMEQFFDLWIDDPESERGSRIELSLVRYFARMSGRATPFGLFAGGALGTVAAQTRLVLHSQGEHRRQTRLDMDYLFALVESFRRDPSLRNTLVYHPNSTLYRVAGRVRYIESRLDGNRRTYHLVALEETEYLTAALNRAAQGSSLAELASVLVCGNITQVDAEAYIGQLVENQVLVAALALPVTGSEPIRAVIEQLGTNPATAPTSDRLAETRAHLEAIDAAGLGVHPSRYRELARILEALPAPVELQKLFQVDLLKTGPGATLGRNVVVEIARGIGVLHRLFGTRPENDDMSRFRESFRTRYGDQEVPLLEALDDEMGIGFPPGGTGVDATPLLERLALPRSPSASLDWQARDTLFLARLCEALSASRDEVVIQPADLERVASNDLLPMPDSLAVLATLAAADEAALAKGQFRVLIRGIAGPSGARLLGRFCHADAALREQVERHLAAEEALRPDAIFAEVVHLPEGRTGNILHRPILRGYEIPYLGDSGAPADRRIPAGDLLVAIRDDRIRLWSRRLGREVIPRLTSAHNYRTSPSGVYRFLASLQGQGTAHGLAWDWGALREAPFLPRVVMGRLVFCLARWRLPEERIRALTSGLEAERFRAVQLWRGEHRLPRWIALAEGDNTLPVDLDNVLSVETFLHLIKGRKEALLTELFPGPDELYARGPEGRYVQELVVPFARRREEAVVQETRSLAPAVPVRPPEKAAKRARSTDRRRSFPPGLEWLYAKLYTGPSIADQVLCDVIKPLSEDLTESGAVDRWFFIRYSDPEPHLRVRFHGLPKRLHAEAVPAFQEAVAPLLDQGRIWRVQLDTYDREVERYGGPDGIELSERLFHADSEAVLDILERLEPGDAGLDERWKLAVRGIDCLLGDFGLDLKAKHQLVEEACRQFAKEFRVDKPLIGQLGDSFRRERNVLEALLDRRQDAANSLHPGIEILRHRSQQWAGTLAQIKARANAGRLTASLQALAGSHAHMHTNRLLRSAQRPQEMVIYEFLSRLYGSQLARAADYERPLALAR